MKAKKAESANLENKRTIFLEIGMIITLVLVLCAFNWKTYDKKIVTGFERGIDNTPVEMIPVTIQKQPELPQPKKPRVIHTINIIDDHIMVDEDYIVDAEIDNMDTVPVYVPVKSLGDEESIVEDEIFRVVESAPEFPGGEEALYAFLRKNTEYPRLAREVGISGKVYITFVVERDGRITDAQVVRGIGGGCDEEALRVVNMMPQWKPGLQRGHAVRVQFIMDIKFTLSQM
ncbi:MAG TPA: energy transducer TonB [Bacteroidales bacterium]|nr:energy transducer TonB [Bacteroidales bacterium]HPI87469.1 energy transducer TonB [Bacteroidales bacterium]HPM93709.1 energy transducer TonB [Bacteroidales bacterium]